MEEKKENVGCLHCGGADKILPMNTRLYSDFGGWTIYKDGQHYFDEDSDKDFNEAKPLSEIEEEAKKEPNSKWEACFIAALREADYLRNEKGEWILTRTGDGFA